MNHVADAVVIGSGALGASTAFYLASRGRRVVRVDKSGLYLQPLRRAMAGVRAELPFLERAPIVELRGGLPTMTPDGHFLIDRLPGVAGFYVASGCNVGGLSISPPIGEDLAGWIVAGGERPPLLAPFRIDRFDGRFASDTELRPACLATYVHKYDEQEVRPGRSSR